MLSCAPKSLSAFCFFAVPMALMSPGLAAERIGVTAALRGEVVRTASLESGAAIGQMSSGQKIFLGDDIKVGAQLALRVPVMRGHFLSLSGSYLESEHDNNYSQSLNPLQGETLADGTQREDETTHFGVSYMVAGASLNPLLTNVFFTAASQTNETQSNLTGFSTQRHVASFRVNYAYRF